MELNSLHALYTERLRDLYSAESQIIEALPKMVDVAEHDELRDAFSTHLEQTRQHKRRLEQIFDDLGESPKGEKCRGMEGLIEEADNMIKEKPDPEVLDAALIDSAQHVEHYEMAGYGTVRTYAEMLGYESHAELLQTTLDEEKETDELLTELAESSINIDAATSGDAVEREIDLSARATDERVGARNRPRRNRRDSSTEEQQEL
jgi:ferritin-like metal-binding protein YciE